MEIHPAEILAMVDRICESVTDDDAKQAVEHIRTLRLRGVTPSVMLQQSPADLQLRVQNLTQEISDLTQANARLEATISSLTQQLQHLDHYIEPTNGSYTMEQFLMILTARMRRSYGWRTDYIRASHETPQCTPVSNEIVQRWQNANAVPTWAVEQIGRLEFRKRHGKIGNPTWTETDENYLIEQYRDDPLQKNIVLAQRCAERFGRPISENSIKGALDRARKKGYLPGRRPARNR